MISARFNLNPFPLRGYLFFSSRNPRYVQVRFLQFGLERLSGRYLYLRYCAFYRIHSRTRIGVCISYFHAFEHRHYRIFIHSFLFNYLLPLLKLRLIPNLYWWCSWKCQQAFSRSSRS